MSSCIHLSICLNFESNSNLCMQVHGDFTEESGSKLDRPDEAAAPAEPIVGAE
jgi:hypothetical protein